MSQQQFGAVSSTVRVAAIVLLLVTLGCGDNRAASPGTSAPQGVPAGAPPTTKVVAELANGTWPMHAGDYGNLRYSPLSTINTSNVQNLRVITTLSTGIPNGHEGQPLVIDNTMYVVTPFPNNLIAVDLTKPGGAVKWIFEPHPDQRAVGIACCDVVNLGARYR